MVEIKKYFSKTYMPAMLGSAIEYYDIALYGYMAPVLVPTFMPHMDKINAYFFYFLFEFFATLVQLSGAYFFGKMGDMHGRKFAMYYSMIGTSIVTFCICLLPTYHDVGIIAAVLFALCRILQSFFLGGEYNGGVIYCIEHENDKNKHGLVSGLYCAFTVFGILIAAFVATIVNIMGKEYFRIAYAISLLLALTTYLMRRNMQETPEYVKCRLDTALKEIYNVKYAFFIVLFGSVFFGIIYGLPTRILNAILPLAVGIDTSKLMMINVFSLIIYMFCLLFSGILSDKYGTNKVMMVFSFAVAVVSYPAMILIETGSVIAIIIAKFIFIIMAAGFIGPIHSWMQSQFSVHHRYAKVSTSYTSGKVISTLMLSLSFLMYERYHNLTSISFVLIIIAFAMGVILLKTQNKT